MTKNKGAGFSIDPSSFIVFDVRSASYHVVFDRTYFVDVCHERICIRYLHNKGGVKQKIKKCITAVRVQDKLILLSSFNE